MPAPPDVFRDGSAETKMEYKRNAASEARARRTFLLSFNRRGWTPAIGRRG
jgi:hypothetical protein